MQRVIIYCRVSSERQESQGHGLDSQEHRLRQYCADHGWLVDRVFKDTASGGGDYMRRPAMAELLRHLRQKTFVNYFVVVDDLKRLARDTEHFIKLKRVLDSYGTSLKCPNFVFEDSPEGMFIQTLIAATSQLEREQNRRQVLQKMKARLECGYWCLAVPPRGYRYQDCGSGKLLVPDEAAPTVRTVLEGYASGRFQRRVDVRRYLETVSSRWGEVVSIDTVNRILRQSTLYAGYLEYPRWEVSLRPAKHEALIPLKTAETIKARLDNQFIAHPVASLDGNFPLRRFLRCHVCNRSLTGSFSTGRNAKYPYYHCTNRNCTRPNFRRADVEAAFQHLLSQITAQTGTLRLASAIVREHYQRQIGHRKERVGEARRQLGVLRERKQRILDRLLDTDQANLVGTYEEKLKALEREETVLRGRSEEPESPASDLMTRFALVADFLENPLGQWKHGDLHTKRLVLNLVFQAPLTYKDQRMSGTSGKADGLGVFYRSEQASSPNDSDQSTRVYGTAILSPAFRLFPCSENGDYSQVHLAGGEWNRLVDWIRGAADAISDL